MMHQVFPLKLLVEDLKNVIQLCDCDIAIVVFVDASDSS